MKPGIAFGELNVAVYERLKGMAPAMGCEVYDGTAAPGTKYPYMVIADWHELPDNQLARLGREVTCALHVFSNYEGVKEVAEIANIAVGALEETTLVTSSWHASKITMERSIMVVEPHETRHLLVRVKFCMQSRS